MTSKVDSSVRASSKLSFIIFAVMSIVMLAVAAGLLLDEKNAPFDTGFLVLGGVGSMIACFATRPKK